MLIQWNLWNPYKYEEEKNDYNSSIKVIEKNYTEQIINNFNELMGE